MAPRRMNVLRVCTKPLPLVGFVRPYPNEAPVSRTIGSVSLSRRSLLTLRFPGRSGPPREPRPYPLPDGAPALMAALSR